MGTDTVPPDDALEVELAVLRARAYGVDADIEDDPRAAARLAELEAWHTDRTGEVGEADAPFREPARHTHHAPPTPDTTDAALPGPLVEDVGESRMPRAARVRDGLARAARSRVGVFAAGAATAAAAALLVVSWFALQAPEPDAVLYETSVRDREQVQRLADYARVLLVDESTLRGHGSFRGVQLWTATSTLGNRCLLAIEPSTDRFLGADCVPPDAEPTVAIYDVPVRSLDEWHDGLPRGTVVRFVLSGDVVTVWVHEGAQQG